MLADMYGGRGADPGTGDHTDAELTRSVRQGQEAGTSGQAGPLRVRVEEGWATLEGAVQSPAEREHAVQAALEIEGTQGVDSRVHVTSTEQSGAGDPRRPPPAHPWLAQALPCLRGSSGPSAPIDRATRTGTGAAHALSRWLPLRSGSAERWSRGAHMTHHE